MLISKRSVRISNSNSPSDIHVKNPIVGELYYVNNLFQKQSNLISKYKRFIDSIDDSKKWDHAKKLSNNYELINISHQTKSSIAYYIPLSRSYFKLWEMIADFNLVDNNKKRYRYAALAEGPGGFIECFLNYRKNDFMGGGDDVMAITLYSDNQDVPDIDYKNNKFKNIKISYGADGTGNLYKLANIKSFVSFCGGLHSMDFVTADGGFDFSANFNEQEQLSYKLLFCESVTALSVNKLGGSFVLKIFDTFTIFTNKLIYLLTRYYDDVYITKPHTSRPANSEKYVICKGFKGIKSNNLERLYKAVRLWNDKENVVDIFDFDLPPDFVNFIYGYNNYMIKYQLQNILKTFMYIDNPTINGKDIAIVKQKQTVFAIEWCKKYNQHININSRYIKLNHFLN